MATDFGGLTPVQQFYKGKTIFITGATGFLGCLILEKLLRACYDLDKIYITVRPKKNKSIEDRKNTLFDNVMFRELKKLYPNFHQKVVVMAGDCEEPNLGLSRENYNTLISEVNVIFHCAATVRFDETLKKAVKTNVVATRDLLIMAKMMDKLNVFVYVGTAYSHCPRSEISELFYSSPMDPDKLISAVDSLSDEMVEFVTPKIIQEWPNTYSYSKAIAEETIRRYGKKLPVAIVRPSIILGTYKEPLKGWINNFYSLNGVLVAFGVGLMHAFRVRLDYNADLVPADYVINCIIAAGWDQQNVKKTVGFESNIPIYNYTNWSQKPITWSHMIKCVLACGSKVPTKKQFAHFFTVLNSNKLLHTISIYLVHFLPGYILDGIARLLGKEPRLVKAYEKINKFSSVLEYFSMREWHFQNTNTQEMYKRMSIADQHMFDFDLGAFRWEDYLPIYAYGLRVYLLGDPISTVHEGRLKAFRLKVLHYFITSLLYLIFFGIAYKLLF